MANHRPKSLSELNNVYDKAMRAERAIKESSSLLNTPETETAPESENIFTQLETKAAEAHKNQVFDPDITNIANDFLKRYAQPEKPKAVPHEIKRPAPSIQSVYHSPAKEKQPEKQDVSLSMGSGLASDAKSQSAPVHKPSHTMPSTETVKPEVKSPEAEIPTAQPTIIYQAPEENAEAPAVMQTPTVSAPVKVKEAPKVTQAPVNSEPQPTVDHTPRPAPSRVRITSTERSELMEEYLRVMSDEDDEPSYKKPKFSFFKKKKKHEEAEESEESAGLYEEMPEEEDTAEEISVVPFDPSGVKYTDEYSDAPEEEVLKQEPMNLYDYIEADFDYEEDEALDMSFDVNAETPAETAEEIAEETEETMDEEYAITEEAETDTEETETVEAEEIVAEAIEETTESDEYPEAVTDETAEVTEEEVIYPAETDIEEAEETVTPQEEAVYEEAPTAGMVFEDIFSVSDENKRSHTGGNWNEVFGEETQEEAPEAEEVIAETAQEASEAEYSEYVHYEPAEAEETLAETGEEAEETEDTEEDEETEEDFEAPKKRTFLKILMALAALFCLAGAGISVFLSAVIGVDTGELFSEKYRAFSVGETLTSISLNKGDLVITENTYAQTDEIFVYLNQNTNAYSFGKVTAISPNLLGDYLYIAQTEEGTQMINRDTCLGAVKATYGGIGSVLSVICDYGIFIAVALVIFAIALIVCLVILISRQRRYEEAAAIYDNPDNFDNNGDSDKDDSDSSNGNDDDNEYYSDYDTDGIEQGLFVSI